MIEEHHDEHDTDPREMYRILRHIMHTTRHITAVASSIPHEKREGHVSDVELDIYCNVKYEYDGPVLKQSLPKIFKPAPLNE